jgi:hypothetical protein
MRNASSGRLPPPSIALAFRAAVPIDDDAASHSDLYNNGEWGYDNSKLNGEVGNSNNIKHPPNRSLKEL